MGACHAIKVTSNLNLTVSSQVVSSYTTTFNYTFCLQTDVSEEQLFVYTAPTDWF